MLFLLTVKLKEFNLDFSVGSPAWRQKIFGSQNRHYITCK